MTHLKCLPLEEFHLSQGAKMSPFSGYNMPVQYRSGVMKEHLHTREYAGLFDVSHMGQIWLHPKSGLYEDVALALEALMPINCLSLQDGRQRYGFLTNHKGGVIDDLMVARRGESACLVVNAGCKTDDIAHLRAHITDSCEIEVIEDRALLALQGPKSEAACIAALGLNGLSDMAFMDVWTFEWAGVDLWVARSGYTGEDGFEISVPTQNVLKLAEALAAEDGVALIGLGARDSLRLEAGLCLYGHDIDADTSPVEAALEWAIQPSRRTRGVRAGGFPGAKRILSEFETGAQRRRVGLLPIGRAPIREGARLFADEDRKNLLGVVTSGGFSPSLQTPIAMGYVDSDFVKTDAKMEANIWAEVRGKSLPAKIVNLPFVLPCFKRD